MDCDIKEDDIYRTITEPSEGVFKDKGSKFLAFAYPVYNESQIKEYIAKLKDKYYDARHHCYSWQLGLDSNRHRVNDDGEPSGTAGKPIYGQIRSHELTNILIVVVRYFGGTKLGVSGLINAYKEASIDALNNATIVEKTVDEYFQISFDYLVMNDVMKVIKSEEPNIIKQDFNLNCNIELSIRTSRAQALCQRFGKIESLTCNSLGVK